MRREYLNDVKFKDAGIKLCKPKAEPTMIKGGSNRGLLKILFTLFIIIAILFTANFVIVTAVNVCRGTSCVTVFDVWQDFQAYERQHSY